MELEDKFYLYHAYGWGGCNGVNISHFFHEFLFWAIDACIRNPSVTFVLDSKLHEWELKFTLLMIKHLKVKYVFEDIKHNHQGMHRLNLNKCSNFEKIMELIKIVVNKEFAVDYIPGYKVLYLRDECEFRKFSNYDKQLDSYFDEVITDMSAFSFEDQVKLFMKCSVLVSIDGAALTNIVFMNSKATVLALTTTDKDGRWITSFGINKCIRSVEEKILNYKNYNDTMIFDDDVKTTILDFVNRLA